eukprot:359236-Chlamydomonas_euryale.AAC.6
MLCLVGIRAPISQAHFSAHRGAPPPRNVPTRSLGLLFVPRQGGGCCMRAGISAPGLSAADPAALERTCNHASSCRSRTARAGAGAAGLLRLVELGGPASSRGGCSTSVADKVEIKCHSGFVGGFRLACYKY